MRNFKPDLLLNFFLFDQKKCLPGIFLLLFFHRSPRKCLEGLSLELEVCHTMTKKVMRPKISNFGGL